MRHDRKLSLFLSPPTHTTRESLLAGYHTEMKVLSMTTACSFNCCIPLKYSVHQRRLVEVYSDIMPHMNVKIILHKIKLTNVCY